MRFSLARCQIFVSPIFMGMITILLILDQSGTMGATLGAMVIHELGHLVVMGVVGCFPQKIYLLPFEINLVSDQSGNSMGERFCISFGGILANVLVWLFVGGKFGNINFFLALFNGLPLYSMDGYQILCQVFRNQIGWVYGISGITTLLVLCLGVWLLVVNHNPMLLLFIIYLLGVGVVEKRKGISG